MLDLNKEFNELGFQVEAENMDGDEAVFVMDFPQGMYLEITDENGFAPEKAKATIIAACYDETGRYIWGSEFPNFMKFKECCQSSPRESEELLEKIKKMSSSLKEE